MARSVVPVGQEISGATRGKRRGRRLRLRVVGIGNSIFGESVGSFDGGAGVEVQVHVAGQDEGQGFVGAAGHDEMAAAGLGDGFDGVLEGFGVEGLAVAHGAEIGEVESGGRNYGQGGGDFVGGCGR